MQKKLTNIFFRPIFLRKPQRSKRAQNKKNWMNNHLTEIREEQLTSGEWLENFLW